MSAETPATPVTPAAAAAAAPPPAAPPPATPGAAPDRHDPARAAPDIHVGSGPARADRGRTAQPRRGCPSRAGQAAGRKRAKSRTRCGFSARRRRSSSTPNGTVACGRRRACETIRPRRRGLARARFAAPRARGGRAAHAALAESVHGRAARRLVHVRTPTFQSVSDFVAAQLARPEYAHFIRASNPGGGTAGTTGAHQAAPTSPANPARARRTPKNFGEAIILQMQEMPEESADAIRRLNPAVADGPQFEVDGPPGVVIEQTVISVG